VNENHYVGVVHGSALNVERIGKDIHLYPLEMEAFKKIWVSYFDLERNYAKVCEELSGIDEHLEQALAFSDGLRMLHQDPWETTISFIISANNNIVRIKKIIENICREYGSLITGSYYAFPTPQQLAKASIEELRSCGLGYRDRYIHGVANAVSLGEFDFENLGSLNRFEAEKSLLDLSGVGVKVAQCIMLFSLGYEEVVPADTWIKKIVSILYSEEIGKYNSIGSFFEAKFGNNSGYAQQVLFHWARQNRLGR
jgi:N-glycosylase/DNA lyase